MAAGCCQRHKTDVEQSSDSSPRLAPSPSGSVSPRPPLTHYQPRMPGPRPTVGGYWPYDSRAASAWGPIVTTPMRYMMDPRSYMWHMSQGGNEQFIPDKVLSGDNYLVVIVPGGARVGEKEQVKVDSSQQLAGN